MEFTAIGTKGLAAGLAALLVVQHVEGDELVGVASLIKGFDGARLVKVRDLSSLLTFPYLVLCGRFCFCQSRMHLIPALPPNSDPAPFFFGSLRVS